MYNINVVATRHNFLSSYYDRIHRFEGTSLLLPIGNQLSMCSIEFMDLYGNVGASGLGELIKPLKIECVPHRGVSAFKALCRKSFLIKNILELIYFSNY